MIKIRCKYCEKQFQVKAYRSGTAKYCSNDCRKEDKIGLWQEMLCTGCCKTFSRPAWKQRNSHKGSYCSVSCYRKRAPQQEIECICGNKFKAHQSRTNYYHRLFCSQKC